MDAVNVSAVGTMAAVLVSLTQQSVFAPFDWRVLVILGIAALMQFGPKQIGAPWIVVVVAILGWGLGIV